MSSLSPISLECLFLFVILAMKCIRNSVVLFDLNNISAICVLLLFDATLVLGLSNFLFKTYNSTNTMGDTINSICVPIFFLYRQNWLSMSYESENVTVGVFTYFFLFSSKITRIQQFTSHSFRHVKCSHSFSIRNVFQTRFK